MLTDRAPFDYRYLSRRLLTDLFQQEQAAHPASRASASITLPFGVNLQLPRSAIDMNNLRMLANKSAQLVSDNTGDLSTPGAYVHDQLELHHGVFAPHMGWDGGQVACYWGETANGDDERVFLALFGSACNVVGRRDRELEGTGYYPSDIDGLYALLDAAREPEDPEIDFNFRWEDERLSPDSRAEAAIKYAHGGADRNVGPHRFLARVFSKVEDYHGPGFGGQVLIGAPLWIATTLPQPLTNGART